MCKHIQCIEYLIYTQRTETSNYLVENKSIEIPLVVASECGLGRYQHFLNPEQVEKLGQRRL